MTTTCRRALALVVTVLAAAGTGLVLLVATAAAADVALGTGTPAEAVPARTGTAPAGSLPGERTRRPMGLPVVLAATGVLGVGSLLVRVLLAEPAAQRPPDAPG